MKFRREAIGLLCQETEQIDPTRKPDDVFIYIDISSVDKDHKSIIETKVLEGKDAPSRARKLIFAGDVLVSTVRPNLNAVAIVPSELDGQIASTGFCVLRPRSKFLESKYLYYRTQTQEFVTFLIARMKGANYPAVTDDDVRMAPIPLPPISEQRRVVEILDQADALRRKRDEVDQKAERILPAIFYRMFGDPRKWQDHADSIPLRELVGIAGGATPSTQHPEYWDGTVPWVSPKDMKFDVVTSSQDRITQKALEETNLALVPVGALLIVVRGMILAHTVPMAIAGMSMTINQDMKALVPRDNRVSANFLHAAMRALHSYLLSLVRTAAHGTRKLDTDDLLNLRILIPSKKKHETFLRRQQECRLATNRIAATRDKLNKLFHVLLHRAFSGDLTAKWRQAHMKEFLHEMEAQARLLKTTDAEREPEPERIIRSTFPKTARKKST